MSQGQVLPHFEVTSPTQMLFHAVEQQYESLAHTVIAHGSQVATNFVPALQMEWAHVDIRSGGCIRSTLACAMSTA
jgi:hypothetical protein